ncbi:MAG: hypothetical protein U1E16_01490 [Hyphomicrobiales bacterium]
MALEFVAVQDGATGMPLRRDTLADGDYLILKGDADAAALRCRQPPRTARGG